MKAKKLIPILALILGLSSFASCTPGDQTVELYPHWGTNQTADSTFSEELTYDVTFEKGSGLSAIGYDLTYKNGKYTTKLVEQKDGSYEYTTTLTIDAVYTLDGKDPVAMSDSVTTTVKFKAATASLQPISSVKDITCYTPLLASKPTSIENCYNVEKFHVETTYAEDGKNGTAVKTNLAEKTPVPETLKFKKSNKYTYLDNEQIPFAFRAFSTDTTSAKVEKYCPFTEVRQTVAISFTAEEESAYTFKKLLINNEEKSDVSYSYRIATMKINAQNSGVSQKVYLTTKAKDKNLILKMETPLSYSLGTLVYSLTSISRTE